MANELLDAAKSSNDDSEERYEKLKKEEAGTDMSKAEQRYEKLKEEATQEFIREQQQREQDEEESENIDYEEDSSNFVTY